MFENLYYAAEQAPGLTNALLERNITTSRAILARHTRIFRAKGRRDLARDLIGYAAWICYPLRRRPNGRYT